MGHHTLRRFTNLICAFVLAVMSVNIGGVMTLQNAHATTQPVYSTPTNGKLTICHSTQPNPSNGGGQGPQGNPYITETISVDSEDGNGANDHTSHTGDLPTHVYRPGDLSWGDIIPSYPAGSYTVVRGNNEVTVNYPASNGLNWDAAGQAIYYNGCVLPLPADASASVNVTDPTCDSASVATIDVTNAALVGSLDQTVGSHTATFTANDGHLFADKTATLTVNYTIAGALTGIQCAGPQPSDDRDERIVTGEPVCLPDGGGTVTSWTEERTRSYSFDTVTNAWVAGEWSEWTIVSDSETTTDATDEQCPAPTYSDISAVVLCANLNTVPVARVTLTNNGNADGYAWVNGKEVEVPANDSVTVDVSLTLFRANIEIWNDNEDLLYDGEFNCTPGGGGGEQPQDPETPQTPETPKTPTGQGITLPETGANPVAQLWTIIASGIITYGAMFYLANRRDFSKK